MGHILNNFWRFLYNPFFLHNRIRAFPACPTPFATLCLGSVLVSSPIPASASSSCPEFGMWIIPTVQCSSTAPHRGRREGRNWNSSSAQALSYFPRWNWKCLSIDCVVGSEYIGILSLEHSAQNTANGRHTSVWQIFNISAKLKQHSTHSAQSRESETRVQSNCLLWTIHTYS